LFHSLLILVRISFKIRL